MALSVAFKAVTLDPSSRSFSPTSQVASTHKRFKNNCTQGHYSAPLWSLEASHLVWLVSLGGPGRKELAPFRGQRSDVAGHGQGIQPRCCLVPRGRSGPSSLGVQIPIAEHRDTSGLVKGHRASDPRTPKASCWGSDPRQGFQNSPSDIQTVERHFFKKKNM